MKAKLKKYLECIWLAKYLLLAPYVHINYWRVHFSFIIKAYLLLQSGLTKKTRKQPIIVNLTTIPSRLKLVHLSIESLLEQSLKPDKLILWLSKSDELKKNTQPLKKQQKRGLEIRYVADIRSYRKLIPALREFPEAIHVTADDDFFYPKDWLKKLYESYKKNPGVIHCNRAHYILKSGENSLRNYKSWLFDSPGIIGPNLNLMPTTGSGCLFPPNVFDEEVFNESVFMAICPHADDIWFKAMSLKKGIPCQKVLPNSQYYRSIRGMDIQTLWSINRFQNDEQVKKVFDQYQLYSLLK